MVFQGQLRIGDYSYLRFSRKWFFPFLTICGYTERVMYRFTKEYKKNGVTVGVGVQLRKNFVLGKDCVSLIGSEVFKDIPMEYLEKFEPIKYSKKKGQRRFLQLRKPLIPGYLTKRNL